MAYALQSARSRSSMSEMFVKYKYVAEDDKHPAFIIVILWIKRDGEKSVFNKITVT